MKIRTLYFTAFVLLGVSVCCSPGFAETRSKVLFVAASPIDQKPMLLQEEIREIGIKIRGADYRDSLELIPTLAARPDDLQQKLLEYKPGIVHFSGHGSTAGIALLDDKTLEAKLVSAEALKALFTVLKDNIQVVVLNACYSEPQAQAIAEVIDCVIGMKKSITNEAAITYAASFYRALGFGRSVQEAHDLGIAALKLNDVKNKEGIPQWDIPELKPRTGVNPAQVRLRQPKPDLLLEALKIFPKTIFDDDLMLEITARNPSEQSTQLLELRLTFFGKGKPENLPQSSEQVPVWYYVWSPFTDSDKKYSCAELTFPYGEQGYAQMNIPLGHKVIEKYKSDKLIVRLKSSQVPKENQRWIEAVIKYSGDRGESLTGSKLVKLLPFNPISNITY